APLETGAGLEGLPLHHRRALAGADETGRLSAAAVADVRIQGTAQTDRRNALRVVLPAGHVCCAGLRDGAVCRAAVPRGDEVGDAAQPAAAAPVADLDRRRQGGRLSAGTVAGVCRAVRTARVFV